MGEEGENLLCGNALELSALKMRREPGQDKIVGINRIFFLNFPCGIPGSDRWLCLLSWRALLLLIHCWMKLRPHHENNPSAQDDQ